MHLRFCQLKPAVGSQMRARRAAFLLHYLNDINTQSFATPVEGQTQHADRRAAMMAAANAAASWARVRQGAWTDTSRLVRREAVAAPVPVAFSAEPAVFITEPAVVLSEPEAVVALSPTTEVREPFSLTPVVNFARSALTTMTAAVAMVRPLGAPVLAYLPRVASAVAVTGVLLGAFVAGRTYWQQWTAVSKTGVAVLESVPDGSLVLVDGKDAGKTPLAATLPVGSHTIEFRYRKQVRTVTIVISPGGHIVQHVDWLKKPSGRLVVSSASASARVLVDGTMRGMTPLTLNDLSVGAHVVRIESPKGSVERSVTVAAGETSQVEETIFPGWLLVNAPIEITINEGTRVIRLDDRGQAMLSPGPHELRLENRTLGYQEVRQVEVRPGETARLSIVPPRSTVNITATAPADVWLDGVAVGQTPLADLPVEIGTHDVRLKSATGERRLSTVVTVNPLDLNVDFSERPSR